jgi:glutamate dehydrogenase (NADP+)
MSDSAGYIYDAEGIDAEKLAFVMELKNELRGRISEYVEKYQINISLENVHGK